jgi:hypothetical protein
MHLVTTDGKQAVTKITPCTSKKTGKTVFLYTTERQDTFISQKKLGDGADVRHALTDAFG